ncbi:hypothetical protein F5Y12DRAFT_773668 [Xylaria sp. FL1777]|nr:hypothetical protein F5Y12DRAFT_773668 [Xylaria sp. FL1777]
MKAASVAAPAAVTAAEAELVQDLTSAAKLAAAAAAADSIFSSILKVVAAHQAIEEARRSPSSTTGNHASPTPISSNSCKLGRALPLNRVGHNTLRTTECGANGQKTTTDYIITSITWPANPSTITVSATCSQKWAQACYHYSSVISNHTPWKTLTCPPEAATTSRRLDAVATRTWLGQHDGNQELVGNAGNWINKMYRPSTAADCARDEFPPAYFLTRNDPAFINSGRNTNGQMIRYLPGGQNTGAASMWNSICLQKPIDEITDDQVLFSKILRSPKSPGTSRLKTAEAFYVHIDVDHRPVFIITDWQQPVIAGDLDGLRSNPCWPQRLAPNDPGFALLTYDQWYTQHGRTPEYDYSSPYVRGQNGPANGP